LHGSGLYSTNARVTCMVCGSAGFVPLGQWGGHDIFRCTRCSFGFVHPMPPLSEIAAIYDRYPATELYSGKAARKIVRAHKRLKRYRHLAPGKRFIDFGCNIGTTVEAARRLGFDAHGTDIDAEAISIAGTLFPGSLYHAGPMETLPVEWGLFDFAFSTEVIEHVPDPESYFAALAARLRPGGVLYLTTPDAGHWRVPADFTAWEHVFPPQHLLYFTRTSMTHFLGRHGFDVIKFVPNLKTGLKLLARKR